jgi:hypothetical protein
MILLVGHPARGRVKLDSIRNSECGIKTPPGIDAGSHAAGQIGHMAV